MGLATDRNKLAAARTRKGAGARPAGKTPTGKRHGPKTPGAQPRRDILSGESDDRSALVRFVISPDGTVVPDLEGKLPGRGLWLKPNRDTLAATRLAPLFSRAARQQVAVPADLAARLETLLAQRCRHLLGLARRAGQAVAGYEKVRAALRGGQVAVLLAASDGADNGRDKLRALAPDLPLVDALDSVEIGAALGHVGAAVHVGLAEGRLARELLTTADKLTALRRSG